MTDDIVTRLRDVARNEHDNEPTGRWDLGDWILDAADEIERLQKELRLMQRAYDMAVFGESDIDENGVLRD